MEMSANGRLLDGSGFGTPVTAGSRLVGAERLRVRRTAPVFARSTGGVRPQAGAAPHGTTVATMTPTMTPIPTIDDQGLAEVRSWSHPV
ncbi:MAG: hypothetical protein ACRDWI_17800 [Jiangellaceae bacterium]